MSSFRSNVTRIKGLSDRRRMPLLGKIRLGIKKVSQKTGNEYPAEVDYFVCPESVRQIFGEQPKVLKVMFPLDDIDAIFPVAYIFYGQSRGVKCKGDGERAWCVDDETKEIVERACPCELLEQGKCKQVGRLMFMIPAVSVGGVYQITTSSYNSIIDIQSGLDFVKAMVGRFNFIELDLKRVETTTHHNEQRQTHYTMQLTLPEGFNAQALSDLRKDNERMHLQSQHYHLPAPAEENPEYDPPDVVADEENRETETPEWLDFGQDDQPAKDTEEPITPAQIKKLNTVMGNLGHRDRTAKMQVVNTWLESKGLNHVESSKELSKWAAAEFIDYLEGQE